MSEVVRKQSLALRRGARWEMDAQEIRLVAKALNEHILAEGMARSWQRLGRLSKFVCWLCRSTPTGCGRRSLHALQRATGRVRERLRITDALDADTREIPWAWVSQNRTVKQQVRENFAHTVQHKAGGL